jgi:hypothetical protein
VLRWNGTQWSDLDTTVSEFSGDVNSVAPFRTGFLVLGRFQTRSGIRNIGYWNGADWEDIGAPAAISGYRVWAHGNRAIVQYSTDSDWNVYAEYKDNRWTIYPPSTLPYEHPDITVASESTLYSVGGATYDTEEVLRYSSRPVQRAFVPYGVGGLSYLRSAEMTAIDSSGNLWIIASSEKDHYGWLYKINFDAVTQTPLYRVPLGRLYCSASRLFVIAANGLATLNLNSGELSIDTASLNYPPPAAVLARDELVEAIIGGIVLTSSATDTIRTDKNVSALVGNGDQLCMWGYFSTVQDHVSKGLAIGRLMQSRVSVLPIAHRTLLIYPNPTRDNATIELGPGPIDATSVELYNAVGERLWSTKNILNGDRLTIALPEPGIFYVAVRTRSATYYGSIMRE